MISFICGTVFAQMCQDWQWMPRPDMNFLSWGYGFFIISGIASIGAGVCFYLEAKKVSIFKTDGLFDFSTDPEKNFFFI